MRILGRRFRVDFDKHSQEPNRTRENRLVNRDIEAARSAAHEHPKEEEPPDYDSNWTREDEMYLYGYEDPDLQWVDGEWHRTPITTPARAGERE